MRSSYRPAWKAEISVRCARRAATDRRPRPGWSTAVGQCLLEGVRVEPVLLVDEAHDRALVSVVATAGGHHGRAEVATRFQPAGMGAEAVGQDGDVERGQVGEELGVGHEVVDPQVDEARRRRVPQRTIERGAVAGTAGLEEVTVSVDLENRAGVRADEPQQCRQQSPRVHACPEALDVQPDPHLLGWSWLSSQPVHGGEVDDVRVRQRREPVAPTARRSPAAAPVVRVTTASAAGTSTSSCSSCRLRSSWCGLRRSCTV